MHGTERDAMNKAVGGNQPRNTSPMPDEPTQPTEADPPPPGTAELLATLPPLPTPKYAERRAEACNGCSTVLFIVGACVGTTTVSLQLVPISPTYTWTFTGLVLAEAAVALVCLAGLMFGDPGVVRRSEKTCQPPPAEVCRRIKQGEPLIGALTDNLVEAVSPYRSYCARCFVYRSTRQTVELNLTQRRQSAACSLRACGCYVTCCPPSDSKWGHHCSTCQRCVEEFDHHCGVFGRCIAGRGFSGNMGYFKGIIFMGQLGPLTTLIGVVTALIMKHGLLGLGYSAAIFGSICCIACSVMPGIARPHGPTHAKPPPNPHCAQMSPVIKIASLPSSLASPLAAIATFVYLRRQRKSSGGGDPPVSYAAEHMEYRGGLSASASAISESAA